MKASDALVKRTTVMVNDEGYRDKSKKRVQDFTRDRKLPFDELVLYLLHSLKSSTSTSLRRFFAALEKPVTMKQQSLSEARKKLTVSAFKDLFVLSANVMCEYYEKTWHGYRTYAIDGVKIALPSDKSLLAHFGGLGHDKTAATAQGSALYDVDNDIIIDAAIEPLSVDERTIAMAHIDALKKIADKFKQLLLFDRGYPSFAMVEKLENAGLFYLMRVSKTFNSDMKNQTETDGYIWLQKDGKKFRVRVIKFKLDSGEEEILMTNITDKRLGVNAFKKLYFKRWGVEVKYNVVKNKLQVENFNTRTVEGVQQDFFAAMYMTNFIACCAKDAQEDIESAREGKENKYEYKANVNEIVGIVKDRFVRALTYDDPKKQENEIRAVLAEVASYVVPIRDGRSEARNASPRDSKFHHNQKANC